MVDFSPFGDEASHHRSAVLLFGLALFVKAVQFLIGKFCLHRVSKTPLFHGPQLYLDASFLQ
jgi:hypothetical protein